MDISVEAMILQLAAIGLRVGAAFTFMPFFGSLAIPSRIKAAFVIACTAAIYPLVHFQMGPFSVSAFVRLALSELALGLLMGLCLQFVFEMVQLAGQISGFQFSFSLVNVIDPQTNVDIPVLANLQQLGALLLFLQLDVHHWLLKGMLRSFERVPPGTVMFSGLHARGLFHVAESMWIGGLQLAAPVLLATVVLDVAVGFISKAAPQMPVLLLSIPLKILFGYVVMSLAFALWPGFFERQFALALGWSWRVLEQGN